MAPLLALLAVASFEVRGPSTCPRPEAVEQRLLGVPADGDHLVELKNEGRMLQVRLLDRRGTLLGERDLERNSTCDELAEAAAVLVSAWTIDFPAMELPALEPETQLSMVQPVVAPPLSLVTPKLAATPFTETEIKPEIPSHHRGGEHDLDLGFSIGVGERLTDADGLVLSYVYWPLEGMGLEASFHWHLFDDRLTDRAIVATRNQSSFENTFRDLHAPTWVASVSAVGSLARGPTRLLGLVTGPSLELYGVFGVGAGSVHRDFLFSDNGSEFFSSMSSTSPVFSGGAGLRIYGFREGIALEVELRDLFFPDPDGGLTHSLQLQAGLRVSIDPRAWKARDREDRPQRSLTNRLAITPLFAAGIANEFVSTFGIGGSVVYHVWDFVAVETVGARFFPSQSEMTRALDELGRVTPPFAQLSELMWTLGAGVRIHALRGRFAPLGLPFDGDFSLYLAGGIGFGQTRVPCVPGEPIDADPFGFGALCPDSGTSYEPPRYAPIGQVGGGFQLELTDWLGATIEMRDFIYRSSVLRPLASDPLQSFTEATRHVVVAQLGASVLLF
jgi:hypothetical protein